MEDKRSERSQTIGSLIQATVKNASNPAMTAIPSPTNSEIMPSPKPQNTRIGTQLSTTGSPTLRALAEAALAGQTAIDDTILSASLTSRLGSRLAIRARTTFGTKENPGFKIRGYQITLTDCPTDKDLDQTTLALLEALNAPARADFIAGKLARLRVTMARRGESEKDITLLMDTMVDLCREYPADVVASAADYWMRTEKYFPLPKEFLDLMDERVMLRRAVLAAMQREPKRIAPALEYTNWKHLPKERWDIHMWRAYVEDAEAMIGLAKQNPAFLDEATWVAEVEKRKGQIPAGLIAPGSPQDEAAGIGA